MRIKFSKEWLLHPSAIFLGIIVGILIGLTSVRLPPHLAALGRIYLSLLQMCILPIIVTAVTSSVGHLLHFKSAKGYLKKLVVIFAAGMLLAACIALIIGVLVKPGSHLSAEDKIALGQSVSELQKSAMVPKQAEISSTRFLDFVSDLIPTNIFLAIAQGKSLPVLFFFLLLGGALGLLRSSRSRMALAFIDTLYTAFFKIVIWVMYGLPLGLCFLFAGYIGQIQLPVLLILIKWLVTIIGTLLLMIAMYTVILWRHYGSHWTSAIQAFKYPWIVAFGTSSSLATLPAMLRALQSGLKLNPYISELVVPLGVHVNLQGSVVAFVMMGLFMGQFYGEPMTLHQLIVTGFTAIFAAIAVPAVPTILSVGFVALVLQPLGLPVLIGMIVFFTAVPIIDPFITLTNVYGNMVSAILIDNHRRARLD